MIFGTWRSKCWGLPIGVDWVYITCRLPIGVEFISHVNFFGTVVRSSLGANFFLLLCVCVCVCVCESRLAFQLGCTDTNNSMYMLRYKYMDTKKLKKPPIQIHNGYNN